MLCTVIRHAIELGQLSLTNGTPLGCLFHDIRRVCNILFRCSLLGHWPCRLLCRGFHLASHLLFLTSLWLSSDSLICPSSRNHFATITTELGFSTTVWVLRFLDKRLLVFLGHKEHGSREVFQIFA